MRASPVAVVVRLTAHLPGVRWCRRIELIHVGLRLHQRGGVKGATGQNNSSRIDVLVVLLMHQDCWFEKLTSLDVSGIFQPNESDENRY